LLLVKGVLRVSFWVMFMPLKRCYSTFMSPKGWIIGMVCFIVVWESLVGFGEDLMFIHRIYLIIPDLVLLMRARHRMKELLRGSGIWSKFLQTFS